MTAVSDNFDRTNSSNLGASWTEVAGDWEIVSNKVQVNTDDGPTGYYARYETDVGSSDMFSQAVTTSTQADGSSNTGLAVRMRSGATTSYQMTTRHAGDTIGVWRVVAGSESQQSWQTGAQSISTTINSGDTIRVEVVGSVIRGKVQGALVGLCVDTNITDGQRAGLNGYNNVGTDFVELDDFAGGALAADGGLVAPYIVGISGQVTGTGTTLTPTVPSNVATGDLVVVHLTSRDAAQTMTAPGSEGWSASLQTPSQTGLEDAVFAKVWGLGGQTDDSTPTFSIGSGTAGWGATVTVFRNPSHGSAPWTSVSAAVVASGSVANASSATVTAPSVNHDGTNRTVVRLFSSADDNALNTPSSGALAYGAAAYDSTTGNDFSQAMSLREDITVTTNTGTSTVTETVLGNDINNGITLVLAVPSGATINATLDASLGGTATATATPDHPATLSGTIGGTASATATRETFATATAALGASAAAIATPQLSASLAAALGFGSPITATVDHPATLVADLGATATGSATVTIVASATADLGGTVTAAATRETAAVASADVGSSASATATPEHLAALSAPLGLLSAATVTVDHPAVLTAPLGFSAAVEASIPGGPINATFAAALGATASVSAEVEHPAAAAADLGGSAAATAAPDHPAVVVASLGGTVTANATLTHAASLAASFGTAASVVAVVGHPAAASADAGFIASATATVPPTADPNPTIVRLRESRSSGLSDRSIQRLRESA